MTDKPEAVSPGLVEILSELGSAQSLTLDAFRAAALVHPKFRSDIMGLAAEWLSTELVDIRHDLAVDKLLADSADKFWAQSIEGAVDPFHGLTPPELRSIVIACDIDVSVLMKLRNRLIDELTIPTCLIVGLARHLKRTASEILGYLSLAPTLANAEYKAPSPPEVGEKISFAAAVQLSGMSEGQRKKWLARSRTESG